MELALDRRVILDLCGGTGSWSAPYAEAGYDVRVITLPEWEVVKAAETWDIPAWGVLAAPPCQDFAVSGAQYWKAKDVDGRTLKSLEIVTACLMIVMKSGPLWWCLENPVGRLNRWIGPPVMYVQPYEYGDPYTKKTGLWGHFNPPEKNVVEPVRVCKQGSWVQQLGGKSEKTKRLRSITPPGFARAFFEANP